MISNTEELNLTLEQLGRMYRALASLYAEAGGSWQFPVLAEGPLDEIRKLRLDLDAYAGVPEAVGQGAHLVLRLEGARLEWPETPASALTTFLDAFRKGIRAVAGLARKGRRARSRREVEQACDLRVAAILPGSLELALRIPDEEDLLDRDMVAEDVPRFDELTELHEDKMAWVVTAIEELIEVAGWASSAASPSELEERIPDVDRRRALLHAVRGLLPAAGGVVDCVVLHGRLAAGRPPVALTRAAREGIVEALRAMEEEPVEIHYGDLREIDLDQRTFVLRTTEGSRITFGLGEALPEVANEALGRSVRVTAALRRRLPEPEAPSLSATDIELLEE